MVKASVEPSPLFRCTDRRGMENPCVTLPILQSLHSPVETGRIVYLQPLHFFSYTFVYDSSFSEGSSMNSKKRINQNFVEQLAKTPSQVLETSVGITPSRTNVFLSGTKGLNRSGRWRKMTLGTGALNK